MKNEIVQNLKDDKGLTFDMLIYLIDNMVSNHNEEIGMNRFYITKELMKNQYKSKYTFWIIEELLDEDSELADKVQKDVF